LRLSLNGSIYNIYEQGEGGPTLIFLHYFGGSSRAWRGTFAKLNGFARCIAPDLRGFGDSEASTARYRMGNYADDLAALVEALKLKRYMLVGHAMGGKIALAFAARQPERLEGLALFAPSPPTPEPISDEERQRLLTGYGNRTVALETIQKASVRPIPTLELKTAIEDSLRASHTAWRAWLEQGSREDISMLLPYVNVPTLVVTGAGDTVIPFATLKTEVEQRIAHARTVVVPGLGHLIPLEAPQVVASMVQIMRSGGFDK
jgi:pimeloyl-ACP methyl ester carboxylesterase